MITDEHSHIRKFLGNFNEKTLAVDTESAGVAQALYEEMGSDPHLRGWLAVRGISDHANVAKNDTYREIAASHAALVTAELLPFLFPTA